MRLRVVKMHDSIGTLFYSLQKYSVLAAFVWISGWVEISRFTTEQDALVALNEEGKVLAEVSS